MTRLSKDHAGCLCLTDRPHTLLQLAKKSCVPNLEYMKPGVVMDYPREKYVFIKEKRWISDDGFDDEED